ncbi:hypothetical protein [Ligilactobacillus equi]|uniref:Uncharacterized protein n=1 Tax=Ligilactobacillus equi DSM 15833 = JCM 10991 TaxID=1423740 RepID=A0A0R1TA49_9LACO|nr:hypothetical protein [Ligilactobacillus equi]KRL78255.1 hypothetical protein FC36_GL001144 [Ligilactobacillus equi DSM 15833 = JCM 10991]
MVNTEYYTRNNQTTMTDKDWKKLINLVTGMEQDLSRVGVSVPSSSKVHNIKKSNKTRDFLLKKQLISIDWNGGYVISHKATPAQKTLILRAINNMFALQ